MKRLAVGLILVLAFSVSGRAFSFEEMDSDSISLKAGPTDMTEELSLAWVEAALYPKSVEKGKEVFVEVRLASPVKSVKLNFDTEKGPVALFSDDNKNWSRVLKVPSSAMGGLHAARVMIIGNNDKSIQRTLDFVVKDDGTKNVTVTVLNSAPVVENGETVRQLLPGVKVDAIYKAPFYRVKLEDGKEGWVEASKVKEPTDELYLMGFRAYQNQNLSEAANYFKQALQFDPKHLQSHFYLAKIYMKQNHDELAANEVKETLLLDPQNAKAQAMADVLAQRYLESRDYAKVFDLKPALLIEKLASRSRERAVIEAKVIKRTEPKTVVAAATAPVKELAVSKQILSDSIGVVKSSKTGKGNSIASAIGSVLSMTKSLGAKVYEDGWKVVAASDGLRVIYACRQERGGKLENENFEWKVDQDNHSAVPSNENARLLMNRW